MAYYFSPRALVSQRSSGFKSTSNAIAEIVDNAFDAQASRVDIYFVERRIGGSQFSVDEIIICDDGLGMDGASLSSCLTFGSSSGLSEDELVAQKRLGKFGYGLPNSSLSQSPSTAVYSWQTKQKILRTTMDLDQIIANETIEIPEPEVTGLPQHFLEMGVSSSSDSGTVVQWKNCDRLKPKQAKTLVEHAERLLGRIFRYMIAHGKVIEFHNYQENQNNGSYTKLGTSRRAVANDPLYLTENCTLARVLHEVPNKDTIPEVIEKLSQFSITKTKCKPTNELVEEHTFPKEFEWAGQKYHYSVKTSMAHQDVQKPGIEKGGDTSVGREYGKKLDNGSISFVRSDREIDSGRFGIYKAGTPTDRWWSIEIQFYPDMDDLFGVANNKQYIEFEKTTKDQSQEEYNPWVAGLNDARDELWYMVSKLLSDIVTDLRRRVKAADATFKEFQQGGEGGGGLPTSTPTTQQAVQKTDGKGKRLTSPEKEELVQVLCEKYPNLVPDSITSAVDNFDAMQSKGILLYAHSSSARQLWTITSVFGFVVILVNTAHTFHENIMEPLKQAEDETALAALELFISSLAWSETELWDDENQKNLIEDFRESTGQHLFRYIRDNDIRIEEGILVIGSSEA